MSWVRYSDLFGSDRRWDGVPYEARWHYFGVVAECSRSERYDCVIPLRLAHRASDVPDPHAATSALVEAGFVVIEGDMLVVLEGEADHMLPEGLRERKRKSGQRERTRRYRERQCEAGNHSGDCPAACPARARDGVRNALRQDRTGQDRPVTEADDSEGPDEDDAAFAAARDLFVPKVVTS